VMKNALLRAPIGGASTELGTKIRDKGPSLHSLSIAPLPRPIRILIVDGQPVFREGLKAIITSQVDMAVVAQASSPPDAVAEFRNHSPDIALVDQGLPGVSGSGIDTLVAIREEFPRARIIMLGVSVGDLIIQRALREGAAAYVLKSTPSNELLKIIRLVRGGCKHIPPEIAARLAEHLSEDELTPREIEVLTLIGEGNRNKQIAGLLSIAETTVNFHIKNLVDKLRANDRTHAVAIAIRRGLLDAQQPRGDRELLMSEKR
jgi:DNA-binding NarL/FixJ family response regulator